MALSLFASLYCKDKGPFGFRDLFIFGREMEAEKRFSLFEIQTQPFQLGLKHECQ